MRHRVRNVQKKGLLLMAVNKIDRVLGVPGRQLGLVLGGDALNRYLVVFPILERKLTPKLGILRLIFPHVIGDHQPAHLIETAGEGARLRLVADVPFAKAGRSVPLGLEYLGKGLEFWIEAPFSRQEGIENLRSPRIAAGQQRGTRCRANGLGHIKIIEPTSLSGQVFYVGCWVVGLAKRTKISPAGIVEKDDHDVRQELGDFSVSSLAGFYARSVWVRRV